MQISQVMRSGHILDQILIKYDDKRYLSQFVPGMFDSLQLDSTKGAPQYHLKSIVTIVTYWVPGLPNVKGISGAFSVPFSSLQIMPYVHDQPGIQIC